MNDDTTIPDAIPEPQRAPDDSALGQLSGPDAGLGTPSSAPSAAPWVEAPPRFADAAHATHHAPPMHDAPPPMHFRAPHGSDRLGLWLAVLLAFRHAARTAA